MHVLLVNNHTQGGDIPIFVGRLANSLANAGHDVTIISQRPVPAIFAPLYRLGYGIYAMSLPRDARPDAPRGTQALQAICPLDQRIAVRMYSETDNNLKIQALRQKIRQISPDVCLCHLKGRSQLLWAVTLLGSGVPYVHSETDAPEIVEGKLWNRKGRLAAMSGADRIVLAETAFRQSLPDFLQPQVNIVPQQAYARPSGSDTLLEPGHFGLWEKLLLEAAANKGHTVMDAFAEEPFAGMARLSARARAEWAMRDFGEPMPDTIYGKFHHWWKRKRILLFRQKNPARQP